jgi:hypothetical protein
LGIPDLDTLEEQLSETVNPLRRDYPDYVDDTLAREIKHF